MADYDLATPELTLRTLGSTPKNAALTREEFDNNFLGLQSFATDMAGAFQVGHYTDGTHIDRSVGNDKLKPGPIILASDTGTANAMVIAPSPAVANYSDGDAYLVIPKYSNTGATTLKVGDWAAVSVYKNGAAMVAGDITVAIISLVVYSDGKFHLLTRGESSIQGMSDVLASDLPITTTGLVDVVTLSGLAAGVYMVTAQIAVFKTLAAGSPQWDARIASVVSGVTSYHSSATRTATEDCFNLVALVTLAASGDIKAQISATNVGTRSVLAGDTEGATQIVAIKVG